MLISRTRMAMCQSQSSVPGSASSRASASIRCQGHGEQSRTSSTSRVCVSQSEESQVQVSPSRLFKMLTRSVRRNAPDWSVPVAASMLHRITPSPSSTFSWKLSGSASAAMAPSTTIENPTSE